MKKIKLIPKLAIEGIRKNSSHYLPYMMITIFAVFVFFIFCAIYDNPMMKELPHAEYLLGLLLVGIVLLGIILLPILYSTHQFLLKQRKNELGLYHVLGLDQKYTGMMIFIETLILFVVTVGLGIVIALVFSKLIFLVLLNLAGLEVRQCKFVASKQSYITTLLYFGVVFGINLVGSLWQVGKARPIELLSSTKKGEKQEKGLLMKSIMGIVFLGIGYGIAIVGKVNSMIFVNFFFAVFLVVIGTRLLFRSASIVVLNKMKSTPKLYYKKQHFISISGMLYRMKRNAQSLSNICIFSTMVMITLICTVSLFADEENAIHFSYPLDVTYEFNADIFKKTEEFDKKIESLAKEKNVEVINKLSYHAQLVWIIKEEDHLVENVARDNFLDNSYYLYLLSLEEYNALAGDNMELNKDEVLIFSPTYDFGKSVVYLNETPYKVKKELSSLPFETKQPKDMTNSNYYMIMKDEAQISSWGEKMHATETGNRSYCVGFDLNGSGEDKDEFVKALDEWTKNQLEVGTTARYVGEWEKNSRSMYGGLLFIGIFFGAVFSVCLVLMMYYKQISEGYEDKRNFMILKQVGMSDEEVKETIRKQIIIVFLLPLVTSIMHTFVGLVMVRELLVTIHLYNQSLILMCSLGVMAAFAALYVISYLFTSKAYYKIVR